MSIKRDYRSFDFLLVILVCGLAVFGIIMIESATQANSVIYRNQKIFLGTGLVLMALAAFIDYQYIARFYILIYFVNLAMLLFVLIFPADTRGVSRWIDIGGFFTIQPSEFTKILMIIYLSKFIDKKKETINNISQLALLFLSILLPTVLIVIQPALSATMVVLFLTIVILFSSDIHYKFFAGTTALILPTGGFFLYDLSRDQPLIIDRVLAKLIEWNIFRDYWLDRIMPFLNPNTAESEQTLKSISAIGSGMLTGRGLGQGPINKYNYLPENHNDFIFAVIGEELGFIGSAMVLLVMFIIIVKCLLIALRATDTLGRLIVMGVAGMLMFQVFDNVGVATGIMPNTGMPFPFVSSGGTAMWVSMIGIGLVLNVGMSRQKSIFEG